MKAAQDAPDTVFRARESVQFTAPYRHPRQIWGIGLNYRRPRCGPVRGRAGRAGVVHQGRPHDHRPRRPDPGACAEPADDSEAEIGLVIGRDCRNVSEEEALDHVFGVVPVLDQTAEDILERNPRFLTRSKNFPGFFSFGPEIVPLDEPCSRCREARGRRSIDGGERLA